MKHKNRGINLDEAPPPINPWLMTSFRILHCIHSFFHSSQSHKGKITKLTAPRRKRVALSVSFVPPKDSVVCLWLEQNPRREMNVRERRHTLTRSTFGVQKWQQIETSERPRRHYAALSQPAVQFYTDIINIKLCKARKNCDSNHNTQFHAAGGSAVGKARIALSGLWMCSPARTSYKTLLAALAWGGSIIIPVAISNST